MEDISIYIHIPFCERKCNYCAFTSFCGKNEQIDDYIENLCREIVARKSERWVKTIYIGGGTPSILNENQFEKIVRTLFENFKVREYAEFTVEANPNSMNENLLAKWKSLGVNRLSIGVQSLSDKSLQKIGRLHDKKMALAKVALAKKYFENVSADLIVGLEGESGKDLENYASLLLEAGVKHISCYILEVYENTNLFQKIKKGEYLPQREDKVVEAFQDLSNFLTVKCMEHYEISNFCFPGYESQHNLNYWQRGEYLGFGVSAHSFLEGKRWQNANTLSAYAKGEKLNVETLTPKEEIEEIVMLGLRCKIGVCLEKIKHLGYDLTRNPYFEDYRKEGVLRLKNGKIFLNPNFYQVSNTIISNLLP